MSEELNEKEIAEMLGPVEVLAKRMEGIRFTGKPAGIKIPYGNRLDAENDVLLVSKAAAKLGWGKVEEGGKRRLPSFKADVVEQNETIYLRILRLRE